MLHTHTHTQTTYQPANCGTDTSNPAYCYNRYQIKILTTALFSVLLLNRSLSKLKWFALLMLFVGSACVQYSNVQRSSGSAVHSGDESVEGSASVGLMAVIGACLISGAAGVYLELMLKSIKSTSLWLKNIQLASFGGVFGLAAVAFTGGERIAEEGFFTGYSPVVWLVILDVSAGGLLTALVVKYTDTISKGFATSASIVLSTIVSVAFMGLQLTPFFILGTVLVLTATLLYSRPSAEPAKGGSGSGGGGDDGASSVTKKKKKQQKEVELQSIEEGDEVQQELPEEDDDDEYEADLAAAAGETRTLLPQLR